MASRTYKPGEYFRRSVVAKSSEQSSEQSEDNSVDISRKDLDDHEPQSKRQGQGKLNLPLQGEVRTSRYYRARQVNKLPPWLVLYSSRAGIISIMK